jgi:enoyl-CoA hydratase/carnithine racemase
MAGLVLREDENRCTTLTLNRPEKRNALSIPLFVELSDHIDSIARQADSVGLVILRGAGHCFSAGNDLDGITEAAPTPHFQAETVERLAGLPQPVIAAVEGYCVTGGLELALAADLIVAACSAKFADTHAKFSLTPIWGMSQRLPRRIGIAKAREMSFTCRVYSAAQAEAMGLINFCFADAAFEAELAALARDILANSAFTHRAIKRLFETTDGWPLAAGLAHEIVHTEGRGADMRDRIAAFKALRNA